MKMRAMNAEVFEIALHLVVRILDLDVGEELTFLLAGETVTLKRTR